MKDETITKQIKYVKDTIKIKEKKGLDTTFEKDLIKYWITFRKKHGDGL